MNHAPSRLQAALVLVMALLVNGCSAPVPSPRVAPALPEALQPFEAWVNQFRQEALAAGIRESTLQAAFENVQLRERIVVLDRAQPEFTRQIWDYLDTAASPQRVARGLERRAQVLPEAQAASARYGVPVDVLMAIWGLESNFGSHHGDIPVIDALATLGFDGRREKWAKGELMAALRIIEAGDIDRQHMVGSWAGAMGHTQFMPSVYLAHAVDADGDGRRDLWRSMADVFASTANYLSRAGWKAGEPCFTEVTLPPGFDLAAASPTLRQDSAVWRQAGVVAVGGAELPPMAAASLLMPAGVQGPVLLVGANFRAVLRYNQSDSYALGVCLLAHKLDGGAGLQTPWPRHLRALSREEVKALQTALNAQGFDSGTPDGKVGPATRAAIRQFQLRAGLPADGFASSELVARVRQGL